MMPDTWFSSFHNELIDDYIKIIGSCTLYVNNQSERCLEGKATTATQQKGKATQHNSPETVIFQEKLAASGGTPTHDHQLAR